MILLDYSLLLLHRSYFILIIKDPSVSLFHAFPLNYLLVGWSNDVSDILHIFETIHHSFCLMPLDPIVGGELLLNDLSLLEHLFTIVLHVLGRDAFKHGDQLLI